jgi:hypothetical protein
LVQDRPRIAVFAHFGLNRVGDEVAQVQAKGGQHCAESGKGAALAPEPAGFPIYPFFGGARIEIGQDGCRLAQSGLQGRQRGNGGIVRDVLGGVGKLLEPIVRREDSKLG